MKNKVEKDQIKMKEFRKERKKEKKGKRALYGIW